MKNLGRHGKDVITGFEGTITSAHFYLTGCTQYGLKPKVKGDGSVGDTMFFDETRIEVTGEAIDLGFNQEPGTVTEQILPRKGCDSRERP